jgi:hypothetical protein
MNLRIVPLVTALVLASAAQAQIVPTPRATTVPVTAGSRPFLAARQALQPVDLAARGYVEQEFQLAGQANIYDWATPYAPATPVAVRAPNVAYATRFLVRRPADAKKFSGTVIVELLDPGNRYEVAPLWGLAWEQFLRSGDAYVGLTVKPAAIEALKSFDAQRYAKLSFAWKQDAGCAGDESPLSENGLAWDAIAQLGALLRSSSKDNPLGSFPVRHVLAAGYAQAGGYLVTYINALHARLRLGDGGPVYDGFLQAGGALLPAPLNQCAAPLPAEDPRLRLGAHDVPVIVVNTQSDYRDAEALRRADSDAADDRFRQYELPGVARAGPWPAGQPSDEDLRKLGAERFDARASCDSPGTDLVANPSYHVVWSWLQNWAAHPDDAAAAPPASRLISLDTQDVHDNLPGGLRLPFLEVPVAKYTGSSPTASQDARVQQACRLAGSMQRFDAATLKSLYRTKAEYLRQFNAATDRLVMERALLPADAAGLKSQAAKVTFPP